MSPPTPGCAPRWRPTPRTRRCLIVAQRVSTIRQADQIVVLEHGRIVGVGGHDDLLADCETYREIVESSAALRRRRHEQTRTADHQARQP